VELRKFFQELPVLGHLHNQFQVPQVFVDGTAKVRDVTASLAAISFVSFVSFLLQPLCFFGCLIRFRLCKDGLGVCE
jgi:hypothetical protein